MHILGDDLLFVVAHIFRKVIHADLLQESGRDLGDTEIVSVSNCHVSKVRDLGIIYDFQVAPDDVSEN